MATSSRTTSTPPEEKPAPDKPPADAPTTVDEAVERINNPPKPEPSQEEADTEKEKHHPGERRGMQAQSGAGYQTR